MTKVILFFFIILLVVQISYSQKGNIKIKGFVKDAKTNERLYGTVILDKGIGLAESDSSGYFSFVLKPGKYFIECQYIGYESSVKEINITENDKELELFFYLKPHPIEIEKITISGEKYTEQSEFNTYELRSGDLSNIPVFLESDALRAVQALPGVITVSDASAQVYLRGGNFDETLIALDGVPVYNSYHLGGFFGSFNPDIVDREILYPSNYPVKYQGVLSGVLNINTKNGDNEKLKGIGSVGLVSSKLFLEGPLLKGNFILSARRTYPDLLLNLLVKGQGTFPYYFYDFNGKYNIPINSKNLFTISGFYSRDIFVVFEGENSLVVDKKDDPNWGNLIGSFSYNHFFDKGEFEFNTYYSSSGLESSAKGFHFKNTIYSSKNDSLNHLEHIYIDNNIKVVTVKLQFKYNLTGQNLLIGAEYKNLSTSYYWDIKEKDIGSVINGNLENVFFDFAPSQFSYTNRTGIFSVYFSDKLQITPSFDIMLGYRGIYVQKVEKYLNSPFAKIRYKFNRNIELSAGYGKYYEYFFTKKELLSQSYYSPFAIYFIADKAEVIPSSDHFSLALKVKEILPGIKLEVEGYYKTRHNLPSSNELTHTFSFTQGYAAGFDALLKKENGNFTGWAIYTFSRSIKNDDGYRYFANYDRTHNIKIMFNYKLSKKWKLNALWLFSTGLPLTPAVGKYIISNTTAESIKNGWFPMPGATELQIAYGRKNSYRYQAYHRLDVGITGNFIWWNIIAKPYLQIMNVYMSKNPFNYKPVPNNTSVEEGTEIGSMIIPTIGITLEF